MKIELEKEPKNLVKMNIEIPAKDAVDAYNSAVKHVAQNLNIPGFRKGKAPRNIVEQHVGVERLKYEALDHMLPQVFQKAIQENNLDVVTQPMVESYDFEIGQDVKIVAKVELRPEVKLGEYKGLKIKVEDNVIPEDAYDMALNNLLQQYTTYELVVDRPSNDKDIVVFDFDGYVDGEKIQNGEAKDYSLDLANSNFIKGFAEQLVGHNIGEEFEITVTFPENYHEEKLKGKPATFKIKLNQIKEKVLPELNDEFAQKVGPFKTVDELNADIQKYLESTRETKNRNMAEKELFEKIVDNMEVDIQDTMIDREADLLLEDYKQKLAAQGFSYEQAVTAQGEDSIMESIKKDAVLRLKNSLLINKIAQEEKIELEQGDFEAKLAELEQAYQTDRMSLMKQLAQNPAILNSLSQQAINEKVAKFLMDNNTIEFVAPKK